MRDVCGEMGGAVGEQQERETAIHEAGHAVIGRVLCLGCGYVTIDADADSAGHSIIAGPYETLDLWRGRAPGLGIRPRGVMRSILRARAIAFMAGGVAEEITPAMG